MYNYPILIIASASADASGDKSAAKYSEMSAILGVLGHIWPQLSAEASADVLAIISYYLS